ncbi:MAG TPA: hypothetical protein VF469_23800 [Kofleriaceae bacterium]
MTRRALLIALAFAPSCKKDPPKGDLPPATSWQSPTAPGAATPPAAATPNPHAGMGGGNPHGGGMPGQTEPRTLEKLPDGRLAMGPFSLAAPADWTMKPVTSNMRAANFQLPAAKGAGDADLVVTYFGPQGAGSIDENIDRWMNQLEQPGGKSSRDVAKIEKTKFGGQDATFISVTGQFHAQAMGPGAAPADIADAELLGAIVASPQGPYYFKLVGPKPTVEAGAAAFRAMLASLKVR